MNQRAMLLALLSAGAAMTSCVGMAQATNETDNAGLAEIVVTASKRSEDLQKTSAAISVVDGDAVAVGLRHSHS